MAFRNPPVGGGGELVRGNIHSRGYTPGATGWIVERDGNAEFNDANIRGILVIGDPTGPRIEGNIGAGPDFVPYFAFWSDDSDEADAAYLSNSISGTGRSQFRLRSSDRDDASNIAEIVLITGSDASPENTQAVITAERFEVANNTASLVYSATLFDIDGQLTFTIATGNLDISGRVRAFTSFPLQARADTSKVTASSAAINTTETVILTINPVLLNGLIYRVRAFFTFIQSVATDTFLVKIREDNATGTILQQIRVLTNSTSGNFGCDIETEYVSVADAAKTLVVTLVRSTGTGNITMQASATIPAYLYADYVRG